jgi:CRISPR/Cas system CSM-associated protein Csm3 (group 7 of RAMP superfamily)
MQILIELTVSFDGAFNVGGGALGGSLARRPLLTDWRGLPVVPGSSLKGRLRHTCKQLVEGIGTEKTCAAPRPEAMCPNGPTPGEFCPICRLFGSNNKPSALIFSDLSLTEPDFLTRGVPPPTSLRYGVGISRRRGVAADQLLYDTEVFLPGSTLGFRGEISGEADKEDLGLLVAGLENLITLGGGKTAGLGWCEVDFELWEVTGDGGRRELGLEDVKRRWLL